MDAIRRLGLDDPKRPLTFTDRGILTPDRTLRKLRSHWGPTAGAEIAAIISLLRSGPVLLALGTSLGAKAQQHDEPLDLLGHGLRIIAGNNRLVFGDVASAADETHRQGVAHSDQPVYGVPLEPSTPNWYAERYGGKAFHPNDPKLRGHIARRLIRSTLMAYTMCGLFTADMEEELLEDLDTTLLRGTRYAPSSVAQLIEDDAEFRRTELMSGTDLARSQAAAVLDALLRTPVSGDTTVYDLLWLFGEFLTPEDIEAFDPTLRKVNSDDPLSLKRTPRQQDQFDIWLANYTRRSRLGGFEPSDFFEAALLAHK